jgi:branched-chain amino acid transport system permease protein
MLHDFDKYRLIVYACLILLTLYFLPNGVMGLVTTGKSREAKDKQGDEETAVALPAVSGAELHIENVSRAFGGLIALSDVSVRVAAGSIHALIGPNGAGKTTLINIISGMYMADCGRINVDGRIAKLTSMHAAARQGIVRTFQTLKLFGSMTVIEHVMVGMARHSRAGVWDALVSSHSGKEETRRLLGQAKALLRLLGIPHLAHTPATALSYGHRRLVEIARALAVEPRVLLLDEPAAGLVAEEIRALALVIRKLKSLGMTILLVEHHMDLVLAVSDRITVLDHGAVIADGDPIDIRHNERVIGAYLGPSYAAA